MGKQTFRARQNGFVEVEDYELLDKLFYSLRPLALNLLNANDWSLCLLGTTSFDLANFILCFLGS